ncbi:MAG: NUDIX domain-containing protein [Ruminococcus sp.]|nr:NUDIX domain-containing protein [Ruminococcus sp.]MCM1382809.1 NUDIX domain-containing protein [Muribaculaceae bacterium]MCM1480846.1 NUDIX domain-containing protein [Muribaculaceae bacterium]
MELFDIYDKERNKTGRTAERGKPVQNGDFRMVVHICIFNGDGRMLIQRRQPFKHGWSGMWDLSVGGSAVAGDTSLTAAVREVGEELGLKLAPEELRRVLTVQTEHVFDDIYTVRRDLDVQKLTLQETEVAEVRWADISQIKEMIRSGVFIPYHEAFIDLLFFMKDHDGARTADDTTSPKI